MWDPRHQVGKGFGCFDDGACGREGTFHLKWRRRSLRQVFRQDCTIVVQLACRRDASRIDGGARESNLGSLLRHGSWLMGF
jgi:hypothetical protein